MGRKKIVIKHIDDKQQRNVTFNKRKIGLLKKAAQLAQLCDTQMYIVFNDLQGNIVHFRTDDISLLEGNHDKKTFNLTPMDYPKFITRKKSIKKTKEQPQQPQGMGQQVKNEVPFTPIKLMTDLMNFEEPIQSRYSISNYFQFPIPNRRRGSPEIQNP